MNFLIFMLVICSPAIFAMVYFLYQDRGYFITKPKSDPNLLRDAIDDYKTIRQTAALRVNKSFQKLHPNNCPLIEKTADDVEVGTCCFYMKDNTCPRHGNITKL